MIRLFRYIKHYKIQAVIAPLFKMLEATFELIVPLVMAAIIDIGIKNQDLHYIMKMGAILVGFAALGLTCSLTAQYFSAKAAVGFGTELRHDLFQHIGTLTYSNVDKVGTSTLITRMTSDINQVQSGVNLLLRLMLRSPFIVVGALIMAFTISTKLALVFVITVPVLSLVIYGVMVITIPLYKKVQKALDKILLLTRENLVGVRVVRAFRMQKKEREEFEEESTVLLALQMLVGRLSALLNPVTYIIANAATIAIVWMGGNEVYFGNLTQGEVIALVNYMTQILTALVALSNLIVTYTKAVASAGRINEVFDVKESKLADVRDGSENDAQASGVSLEEEKANDAKLSDIRGCDTSKHKMMVSFDHVSFCYQGSKEEALSNISFQAKRGETIGVIGGTGCGKSTLVNLIPRFYDVSSGTIEIAGTNVQDYQMEALRDKIGVVPQKAVLFQGTIRDNMKMGKEDATDEEIWEALEIAQAAEIAAGKQGGLDFKITQNGKNLSGGQKQRFTIARALVRKPEILILDDSASALDFATDAKLRKAIAEHTADMTVFIVSQRAASIMQADQIIVLDDGAMAGIGTHQELMKTCEVYQEICYSQLSKEEVVRHA